MLLVVEFTHQILQRPQSMCISGFALRSGNEDVAILASGWASRWPFLITSALSLHNAPPPPSSPSASSLSHHPPLPRIATVDHHIRLPLRKVRDANWSWYDLSGLSWSRTENWEPLYLETLLLHKQARCLLFPFRTAKILVLILCILFVSTFDYDGLSLLLRGK